MITWNPRFNKKSGKEVNIYKSANSKTQTLCVHESSELVDTALFQKSYKCYELEAVHTAAASTPPKTA